MQADAALAAARFTPTSDGKSAVQKFEVHGMVAAFERNLPQGSGNGFAGSLAKNPESESGSRAEWLGTQGNPETRITLRRARETPKRDFDLPSG
jgi:hypothetical protein